MSGSPAPAAISVTARSLAPDLARGAMLLFIASANAPGYLYGRPEGVRGYPVPQSIPDKVVVFLQMIVVDGRAYPMFALLFGYGMIQLLRRNTSVGVGSVTVRKLIRRRGWWLVLFGFLHASLLFSGDILGAYGVLGVMLAGVLTRASDRTLLLAAAVWMVPVAMLGALAHSVPPDPGTAATTTDAVAAAADRIGEWLPGVLLNSLVNLVPPLLLGIWAARRRVLDDPERHRRLLVRVGVIGAGLAVVGGLPMALMGAGWWPKPSAEALVLTAAAHTVTGYAGGIGYAAVAGLVAIRVSRRRGVAITALAACGQRSMTAYLLQSVVFVSVLASYGGGLGDRLTVAPVAVVAIATWVMTVLLAEFMRRRGYRGPAEVLLRRLTYRKPNVGRTARQPTDVVQAR
ncbi:DUF418 domain-containing protein [Pseudonocardia asaccharolytica]|uniref:DUF418 domain-containing protein n=1 Tax=Pseudonocardia asaccharolytica DSM 44247 = NBRC 16224 TaxID=1123024 RepID=A0A511D0G8_9PSEU|nr:DUF418 domain-containing protein [Pseudonocardia asaccharolytica]GEL18266.1 hypothetical protein PA7_21030 [Pseudonocardia asaccharolytica DSM 44247 = NBRC 16224]